jgi:superfamily I DNA/RNA helicase
MIVTAIAVTWSPTRAGSRRRAGGSRSLAEASSQKPTPASPNNEVAQADGIACVIGDPAFQATSRVRSLTPELSKGLEFDLVILIDPEAFGQGIEGAVDRYVAMTRATQQLVILTSS